MHVRKWLSVPVALAIPFLVLVSAGRPARAGAQEAPAPAADNAAVTPAGAATDNATIPSAGSGPDNAAAAGRAGNNAATATAGAATENAAVPSAGSAPDNAAAAPAGPAGDNAAVTPAGAATDNAAEAAPGPGEGGAGAEEAGTPPAATLADPIEPVNRAIFIFNDRAYFWVLKPVARGYSAVVPEAWRASVRNFFSNLATPIRFVNNLLQGKIRGAGTELLRLGINSTIGMGGLFDPATTGFHIAKRDEDFGQTLGRYGLGGGFYIVWPLLGPSSARDTVGMVGDGFLDPVNYLPDPWVIVGIKAFKTENNVSLSIGDYEALTESALDPYVAVRDAYVQNRAKKVRE